MRDEPTPRLRWLIRYGLIFTGVVLPAASCALVCSLSKPTWQSGKLADYAAMVLTNTFLVFSPFLAFSMTCLVLALFWPERMARRFTVRFGVYTGMILALQFMVIWLGVWGHEGASAPLILAAIGMGGTLVSLGLIWLALKVGRRFGGWWVWGPVFCLPIIGFLVTCHFAQDPSEALWICVFAPLVLILVSAPFWAVATYVGMSVVVYRGFGGRAQFSLADAMCLLTWLGAYMGTLRISVTKAVEQYAQLPKSPPGCYVCTAAARGHRGLVRSDSCRASDGTVFIVNLQMRRLKCAELALAIASPRLHAAVRRVYDCLGPRLARRLWHPLAADLAYLVLKPAEWLAVLGLRCVVPDFDKLAEWLYNSAPPK